MPIAPGSWVGAEDINIQVMSGAYERLGGFLEVYVRSWNLFIGFNTSEGHLWKGERAP